MGWHRGVGGGGGGAKGKVMCQHKCDDRKRELHKCLDN